MKKKFIIGATSVVATLVCATSYIINKPYTITYDLAGGTMVTKDPVIEVRVLDNEVVPEAKKDHYKFTGWKNEEGEKIKSLNHVTSDLSLTACWEADNYTITFKDGDKEVGKLNYDYGASKKFDEEISKDVVKNHPYENLDGWKNKDGNVVKEIKTTDFGDKELTAYFTGKTYKVTYDLYGGTVEGLPKSYQYGKGVDSLPDATLDGYTFDGWFTDEACTNEITSISKDSHEDLHLYAEYHKNVTQPVASVSSPNQSNYNYVTSSTGSDQASSNQSYSSMNLSVGVSIPKIGYHVNNVLGETPTNVGDQAIIDAPDTALSMIYDQGGVYINAIIDHAYYGLDSLPYRISAGDKLYLNGVEYTYSGYYAVNTNIWNEVGDRESWYAGQGYRLAVQTCVDASATTDYICFFY